MNRGIRSGLSSDAWRKYDPKIATVGTGLTQPVVDSYNGRYQPGRFQLVGGLCLAQVQFTFGVGTFNVGVGAAYAMSLPVPARRAIPDVATVMPIGQAMCYLAIASPFVNVPCVATLADPWASLAGQHDSYFQLFAPQVTSWGVATIAATTNSIVVTHRCGYAPAASDITLTLTTAPAGTTALYPFYVSAITATTFTINSSTNLSVGSTALDIGWKITGEPPSGQGANLVGPFVPFDWTRCTNIGPFGLIFVELAYEPR